MATLTMKTLKRKWVWLSRWRYTRGFGVQSPWAYSLIRYVINEHYPYYAYDELVERFPEADRETMELALLYFRIANYRQACTWRLIGVDSSLYEASVQAGCHGARIIVGDEGMEQSKPMAKTDVLVMSADDDAPAIYSSFATQADDEAILVVEGIHRSQKAREMWKMMKADERSGVSFDLYRCGLIFFDRQRHKQSYTVNF